MVHLSFFFFFWREGGKEEDVKEMLSISCVRPGGGPKLLVGPTSTEEKGRSSGKCSELYVKKNYD